MPTHPLTSSLLAWYDRNARRLPWRESRDPYAVWVSEIMLQQTRVETVIPYYLRWMERYPDLITLARSDLQQVLLSWEGLGYYSRARNLHNAAAKIVADHGGQIPDNYDLLIKLPGIGPSSAADILSVAYGKNLAALDGNIKRVLARLFNLVEVLDSPDFISECHSKLDLLLPDGKAGDFNQAIMDLGATICLPKKPACLDCPIRSDCQAYQTDVQMDRPVPKPRKDVPHFIVTAGVILNSNGYPAKVLLAKRPANGLLGGMWEYPGGKIMPDESLEDCLARELEEELGITVMVGNRIGTFKHAYTHFRVTLHAYQCQILNGIPTPLIADEIAWVELDRLDLFPMGKIDRLVTRTILETNSLA